MDNVTSALTSLQRTQETLQRTQETLQRTIEQNQLATQAQFDRLRDSLRESEWRLLNRMDRQFYWLMGFVMANMTATIGILVRLLAP